MLAFYGIPNCTTCKKVKQLLSENGITFEIFNLKEETPSAATLREILADQASDSKQLFNTSGQLYRDLELKTKLSTLSIDEKAQLLYENGMLIKRPLIIGEEMYTIGSKQSEKWLKK